MIVIADTSVLLNLALVGQLQLLQSLFGAVIIPLAVQTEFERLAATNGRFGGLTLPDWVQMKSLEQTNLIDETLKTLDPGESAAISLAIELHADAVLMDEARGAPSPWRMACGPLASLAFSFRPDMQVI